MKRIYQFNPLGSVFIEGEVRLIVVEQNIMDYSCNGCYYAKRSTNCRFCAKHGHVCTPHMRKDKKNVVFALVR